MNKTIALWLAVALAMVAQACTDESTPNSQDVAVDVSGDGGAQGDVVSSVDGGATETGRKDLKWDPTKPGPYRVGFRTYKHAYTAKLGGIPPRELNVQLWYPTQDKDGTEPTYFNAWAASFFFSFEGEKVLLNAKPAPAVEDDRYPVLVVSHGANGFGASTASLNHYFASHGWVVAAPDHVTDTLADVGSASPFWLRLARPLDISATIDSLEQLKVPGLAGKIATESVAMAGHSRGGVTTWASSGAKFDRKRIQARCDKGKHEGCAEMVDGYDKGARDKRVTCGIPMAGAGGFDPWFGDTGHSQAKVAQLQLSGSLDKDSPQQVYDAAGKVPITWVDIEDACHQAFAMGHCPKLTNKEGFAITNGYALAFARYQVLADRTTKTLGVLDGTVSVSPRATLKRKNIAKD